MRRADLLLVLLIPLWALGSFYVAASHEEHNANPFGFAWLYPQISHETHLLMGYIMFLVSFAVIFIWAWMRE